MWILVPAASWDQSIKKGLRKFGPGSSLEYSHAKTLGYRSRDDSLTHHSVDTVFSIMVSCYATSRPWACMQPTPARGGRSHDPVFAMCCRISSCSWRPYSCFFSKWQCKYNIENLFDVDRCVDWLSRCTWCAQTHRLFFNQDCAHFLSRDIVGVSLPDYLFDRIPSKM